MSADIDEQAARWHQAQDSGDMDWSAFTDWLEADPRHREAFDAIALLDERIDAARPTLVSLLSDETPPARRRIPRIAALATVAALLLGVIAFGLAHRATMPTAETVAYTAPIGRNREVRLADGSVATLAPGSSIEITGGRSGPIKLAGSAFFDVRHDPAHPMTVQVAGYEVRDIGTRFDVSATDNTLRVAVAEGRVAVKTSAGTVEVGPGEAIIAQPGNAPEIVRARLAAIGAWRRGTRDYDDVPLAIVVADIGRATGQAVTIGPVAGRRRFSGVIAPGNRAAMVTSLATLARLTMHMDGNAVHLGDGAGR